MSELGNLPVNDKGKAHKEYPKGEIPRSSDRGRVARSSDEGSVMEPERRGNLTIKSKSNQSGTPRPI